MAKFLNKPMGDLAAELSAGLVRLRRGYIDSAERLIEIVQPDEQYPYDFVVFKLTSFRAKSNAIEPLPGKTLRRDLLTLILTVCDSFPLRTSDYGETAYDTATLAKRFEVSTKTIQRWRRRGLVARRLIFPDGKRRVAFLHHSVQHFVDNHRDLVSRSARFSQLTDEERDDILRRARRMAGFTECALSEVARRIAARTGRAVETVRYTIRNHDLDQPEEAIFPHMSPPLNEEDKREIYRLFLAGASVPKLARQYSRTRGSIYRVVNEVRASQLLERQIDCVYSDEFDRPDADELILGPPAQRRQAEREAAHAGHDEIAAEPPAAAEKLPPYLKSLYEVPLLTGKQEADLFRRYNYLKHKADQLRARISPATARTGQLKQVESLLLQANVVKNQIIRANLRLVVSIAKKHLGGPQGLFELISDGNVALMRAVEKFDYAKGYRFSTYASWAIMRNFARSVPKERTLLDRFSTGHEEVLDIAATMKSYDPNEANIPELRESIDAMLTHLSVRERTILIDHYGLDDAGDAKTFDQLGQRFGISKERVRQIELGALRKLRKIMHPQEQDLLS